MTSAAQTLLTKVLSSRVLPWVAASAGLLWHAASYDFFCDDGYIALRYVQSLLAKGELTYNTGERVEGFTSPLWVLLVALFGVFGGSLVSCAKLLGAVSGVATLAVTSQLWRRLAPQHSPRFVDVVLALLAVSPSFAAWTMGGLEAPLFALGVCTTLVLLGRAFDEPSIKNWVACGAVAGLSGLARPEGMALATLCVAWAALRALRTKDWNAVVACAVPVGVILGGYLAFRLSYYGYPFPNTYYVKTSGGAGLGRRGIKYVTAMARQFGWPTVLTLAFAVVKPAFQLRAYVERTKQQPSYGVLHLFSRMLVVGFIVYLTRIGGDFLDLYRFIVPVLPIALCLIVCEVLDGWSYLRATLERNRWIREYFPGVKLNQSLRVLASLGACVLLFSYAQHSLWMGAKTTQARWYRVPTDAPKRPSGVEPIAWTRKAALEWVALGRTLAKHAKRGDTMAMGAAGAAPFSSKLRNLDLYGLTDEWVAHHGRTIGSRPGHQRFATREYIRKWKPTYLFLQRSGAEQPTADDYWNKAGYTSATLKVQDKRNRQASFKTHYVSILVHKKRVRSLRKHRDWRFL